MSVDISKSRSQIVEDAKKDLDKAFPTEDDKLAAGDKLKDALSDNEEVRKKAYEDVKTLATTIRNIRSGFLQVAGDLVGFDGEKFKDKNGSVIELGSKWQLHIDQFDATMQLSLEHATDAATLMKSVNKVLGEVTVLDGTDLKNELTNFKTILKKKEANALLVKDKFQTLSNDVKRFTAEIDTALEDAAEAIRLKVYNALSNLHSLYNDLNNINSKIAALSHATAKSVAVGATASVIAICTLNPIALGFAIGSFLDAIFTGGGLKVAIDERDNIIRKINHMQREIAELNARDQLLKKYKTELDKTKETVSIVSDQIAVMTNIWQTLNLDMHALAEELDNNIGPDTRITRFFLGKLKVSKAIYAHLVFVLETYIEQTRYAEQ